MKKKVCVKWLEFGKSDVGGYQVEKYSYKKKDTKESIWEHEEMRIK